jgi:hypothetical protein
MLYTYWNLTGRTEGKHENDPSVQSAFAVTKMPTHENKLEKELHFQHTCWFLAVGDSGYITKVIFIF